MGNSKGFIVPKGLLAEWDLEVGDYVEFSGMRKLPAEEVEEFQRRGLLQVRPYAPRKKAKGKRRGKR